ncbi:MAG: CotH kinase family protein [Oscillospiraceae bacterium]|nr:CotH kinase family protein [Oscillospiraceae bacterium]
MIASKHITRVVVLMVCVCLLFCGLIVYAANTFDTTKTTEYEKKLFGDKIISLDIRVDQGDWRNLLDNAQAKEWISADLIINGERFSAVGIRTKGNSSLSQSMRSDEVRYSLQFKFNKYVKGQTYYGLDTFCINNMMGDATYMKDYLSYEIMNFIGVDTPLTNYASVAVNGEDYGFCLALERYDKAFVDRVYSTSAGELYSVKIGMGMRGDFEDDWQDVANTFPGRRQSDGNNDDQQSAGGGARPDFSQGGGRDMDMGMGMGMGGFGGGRGGGSLAYISDDPADYSAIFDNAVFGTASDKDKQRVITAIENLNAGTDLEKYFDVDEILRYFAAHTVVVNLDSYTSNMAQNYYIYENDGKMTILPWDYGLAFGRFQSGNASSVVNYPIDTPVSGVSMEDRPLLNKMLEVDEYLERYHSYLRQIVEGYFESGSYENTIHELDAKINDYVKNDVNVFYTYEQYETALPQLIELGRLRAESIKGQLDGTIPSTTSGQSADSAPLIDASDVNISALGSMMGGGGMGQGGRQDWQGERFNGQDDDVPSLSDEQQPGWQDRQPDRQGGWLGGGMFDMELMQQAMQILRDAGGDMTDEVKEALIELGLTEEQIEMFANTQNRMPGGNRGQGGFPDGGRQNTFPGGNDVDDGNPLQWNMPGGNGMGNPSGTSAQSGSDVEKFVLVIALIIVLVGALVFIAKPKKDAILR